MAGEAPFGDEFMSQLFGKQNRLADVDAALNAARKAQAKVDAPMPTIRGKRIDGVLYVRADDVADALETQAPTAARRLIAKLRRSTND